MAGPEAWALSPGLTLRCQQPGPDRAERANPASSLLTATRKIVTPHHKPVDCVLLDNTRLTEVTPPLARGRSTVTVLFMLIHPRPTAGISVLGLRKVQPLRLSLPKTITRANPTILNFTTSTSGSRVSKGKVTGRAQFQVC